MAAKITNHYHRKGYFVAQAYLPAQDIKDGAVTIAVIEGRYGNITLRNQTNLSNALANGLLEGLNSGDTVENRNGTIRLLGGMQNGTVNVSGTLDASAPNGGNGGFIETSAARVTIANDARVTTAAAMGLTGTWLIDPEDFIIGGLATDNISGATLSALLVTNSVVISTVAAPPDTLVAGTPPSDKF